MRNFYISEVSLTPHILTPQISKMLKVNLIDYDDMSEVEVMSQISVLETIPEHLTWLGYGATIREIKKLLNEVELEFIASFCGILGLDLLVLDEKIKAFEDRWKKRCFSNLLSMHGVSKRLTYEQALEVIEMVFLLEPVMNS